MKRYVNTALDVVLSYFRRDKQPGKIEWKDFNGENFESLLVFIRLSESKGGVKWWNEIVVGDMRSHRCSNGGKILLPLNTTCTKARGDFYIYYNYDEKRMPGLEDIDGRRVGMEVRITTIHFIEALNKCDDHSIILGSNEVLTFADISPEILDAIMRYKVQKPEELSIVKDSKVKTTSYSRREANVTEKAINADSRVPRRMSRSISTEPITRRERISRSREKEQQVGRNSSDGRREKPNSTLRSIPCAEKVVRVRDFCQEFNEYRSNDASFIDEHIFKVWSRNDNAKYKRILAWFLKTINDPVSQRTPLAICDDTLSGFDYTIRFLIGLFGNSRVDIIRRNLKFNGDKPIVIVENPVRGYRYSLAGKAHIILAFNYGIHLHSARYLVAKCDIKEYTEEHLRLLPLMCDEEEIRKFKRILFKFGDYTPDPRELTNEERYIRDISSGDPRFMLDRSLVHFLNGGDFVSSGDLFKHYTHWCKLNKVVPEKRNTFTKRIKDLKFEELPRACIEDEEGLKRRKGVYLDVLVDEYDRNKHVAN